LVVDFGIVVRRDRTKLVMMEVAGLTPPARVVPAQGKKPRVFCS
jgi:hypothetical protein